MKIYLIITAVLCAFLILYPLALVGLTTESITEETVIYETTAVPLSLT